MKPGDACVPTWLGSALTTTDPFDPFSSDFSGVPDLNTFSRAFVAVVLLYAAQVLTFSHCTAAMHSSMDEHGERAQNSQHALQSKLLASRLIEEARQLEGAALSLTEMFPTASTDNVGICLAVRLQNLASLKKVCATETISAVRSFCCFALSDPGVCPT